MCYICNNSPHITSCPFSKKTSPIKCAVCGSSIFEEDIFYKLNNENFIHKLDIGSQFFSVGKNSKIVVKSDDTGVTGTCSYRKRYI